MSFTYNGVNCETLGMYVEKYPNRPFPQRKQTIYSVRGRSGDLIVDENAYTNVTQEYEVYVNGGSVGLQTRLSAIAAWLLTVDGYANLTDSYDTASYRRARVANAMDFLNSLNKFGKATIQFDCQPQRFPTTDEVLTGTFYANSPLTITYPSGTGLLPAYPKIELLNKGATDFLHVTAGNLTVIIGSTAAIAKIVIDFETQSVYNAYNNTRPYYTSTTGSWDMLGGGSTISAYDEDLGQNIITLNAYTRRYRI